MNPIAAVLLTMLFAIVGIGGYAEWSKTRKCDEPKFSRWCGSMMDNPLGICECVRNVTVRYISPGGRKH
jgi:hypothetical protein